MKQETLSSGCGVLLTLVEDERKQSNHTVELNRENRNKESVLQEDYVCRGLRLI